jgi:nuclear transcription factor Y gamma
MAYPTSGAAPFVQAGDDLNLFLRGFWKRQIQSAEHDPVDVRHPALPLARIKKVMKSDPEIKVRVNILIPNDMF